MEQVRAQRDWLDRLPDLLVNAPAADVEVSDHGDGRHQPKLNRTRCKRGGWGCMRNRQEGTWWEGDGTGGGCTRCRTHTD